MTEFSEAVGRLRQDIDALDDEILALVCKRARLAQKIGDFKKNTKSTVFRPEREASILRRLAEANPGPLSQDMLLSVFREIISSCRALESAPKVAYLGPQASYSEEALLRHFGAWATPVPALDFSSAVRLAENGGADFVVLPVENSIAGSVGETLDLLARTSLTIVGEVLLPVRHALLGRGRLEDIRQVYAHPQALAQCRQWLATHLPHAKRVALDSNAQAAQAASGEEGSAAIAGKRAAQVYGIEILACAIADDPTNTTRFLVLGKEPAGPTGCDKTSLVAATAHKPGAAHALLEPLARHGISMTRFESRPARWGLWEYIFFIDFLGHAEEEKIKPALADMRLQALFLKNLGSYPMAVS